MRYSVFLVLFYSFFSYSQTEAGSRYKLYGVSASPHLTDSVEIQFDFFTSTNFTYRDELDLYFLAEDDTLKFKSSYDGSAKIKLLCGLYDLLICSELTEPFLISSLQFSKYRAYFIEIYLQPRIIKLPEIRYDLGKPVIYFYSDTLISDIELQIITDGDIKFTYPEYKNDWRFEVEPGGDVRMNNTTYPYLFWDAKFSPEENYFSSDKGFTVSSDSVVIFLDSLLTSIGFGSREKTDFIVYWVPQMKAFQYTDIYFRVNESCDQLATLQFNKQPASLYRIYMIWRPSNGEKKLSPQRLPRFEIQNFSVLEWGGMQVNSETAVN